jgi:hypothetical protein
VLLRQKARRMGPSPADQAVEIARLRKDLEHVRMERDISSGNRLRRIVLCSSTDATYTNSRGS